MEALSGLREGLEGSGDSCWILSECGGGQFGLVDRGGLGAACRPFRAERGVRGEWDSCLTLCEWGSGQFGLVDRGRLGAAWRPSRGRERGRRGVGIHAGPFVSGVRGNLGL